MLHPKIVSVFLLILLVPTPGSAPDEGQWLPAQFVGMDWKALKSRGMELTKDEFWHPEKGGVLSAAVQINGCSASFISADGLMITNHHCGFGAINRLSTVENNYVENGFVAETRMKEKPAPGMRVSILDRMEDVTERMLAAKKAAKTDLERYRAVRRERSRIEREARRKNPGMSCSVASFFDGRQYFLYYRTLLRDVRLVYAPPRSVGEFGGDEDNWMWPRHTGDFCFFRAYAGPDNKPALPSPKNVPYKPRHWMKVSAKGVQEGDLALILGYPGRTERYVTSTLVKSRQEARYPLRLKLLTQIIGVYEDMGKDDPELALQLQSQIKSMSNVQKNALGMVKGLARNGVVKRKLEEEAAFSRWAEGSAERKRKYGRVLADLLKLDASEAATESKDVLLSFLFQYCTDVFVMTQLAYAAEEATKPDEDREPGYKKSQVARIKRQFSVMSMPPLRRTASVRILAYVFDAAQDLPPDQRIPVMDELLSRAGADPESNESAGTLAAGLLSRDSAMKEPKHLHDLFESGWDAIKASDDPRVVLGRGLAPELRSLRLRRDNRRGARMALGALWIEAQEKWRGSSFYPDANSTLRISSATVKGYAPYDGAIYNPFTTLAGVLQKETGRAPFTSPPALLKAAAAKDKGRFCDQSLGDVPVCFLTDGDTTGGNSGSPVINGKGELVGINFDRVFENVAGDYGWIAERSRNISVDIRYVLWILDKVMPAHHLLKEMGV